MSDTSTLGAILTGGRSTRMGRDKADVAVEGEAMLDRVAQAIGRIVGRTVLLGPDRPGWECWPDGFHAHGPLAGVATALTRTTSERVLLVAVDQPFLRIETLKSLLAVTSELPVVPVDRHGTRQVTCAIYPATIADAAADEASSDGSIQTLLDRVSFTPVPPEVWESWGEDGRSWFSVDDETSLVEGVARYMNF